MVVQDRGELARARVEEISIEAFRDLGLLWWVNRQLHPLGFALVAEYSDSGDFTRLFPARTEYSAFAPETEVESRRKFLDAIRNGLIDGPLVREVGDELS